MCIRDRFISYGGTSILFLMAEIGIALGVSGKIKLEDVYKRQGQDIEADYEALNFGRGYDHTWVIDGSGMRRAAVMRAEAVSYTHLDVYKRQASLCK